MNFAFKRFAENVRFPKIILNIKIDSRYIHIFIIIYGTKNLSATSNAALMKERTDWNIGVWFKQFVLCSREAELRRDRVMKYAYLVRLEQRVCIQANASERRAHDARNWELIKVFSICRDPKLVIYTARRRSGEWRKQVRLSLTFHVKHVSFRICWVSLRDKQKREVRETASTKRTEWIVLII